MRLVSIGALLNNWEWSIRLRIVNIRARRRQYASGI